jgi:hypothetical protein
VIPAVRVLGLTNDEKGDQLEKLTYILLARMGFHDITTNFKGAGGEEIDLRAKCKAPGFKGGSDRVAICECKAQAVPANMDAWLKFCGKVFTEESRSGTEPDGYFISLSGVNGNVVGNHDGLGPRRERIRIISGSDLLDEMQHAFLLAPTAYVQSSIATVTDRAVSSLVVVYYHTRLFWLVEFAGDQIALLGPDGGLLAEEVLESCRAAVNFTFQGKSLIDLRAELSVRRAGDVAKRFILARLMVSGGALKLDDLNVPDGYVLSYDEGESRAEQVAFSDKTVLREQASALAAAGLLNNEEGMLKLSPSLWSDAKLRIELFRTILERFPTDWPGCALYDEFIDTALVESVAGLHHLGELNVDEMRRLRMLLQWSPSALKWMLSVEGILPDRSAGLVEKGTVAAGEFLELRKSYLFSQLNRILMADALDINFARYFRNVRDVHEVEARSTVVLKSDRQARITDTGSQRLALTLTESDDGSKGVYTALVPDSALQPWEYEGGKGKLLKHMAADELASALAVITSASKKDEPE